MSRDEVIGKPVDRLDGTLKVSGKARYSAEVPLANIAHAVAIQSTIARGRVKNIDTQEADRAPGVLRVITYKNAPKLQPFPKDAPVGRSGQSFVVLQNDIVHYAGQYLGVVVANTLEQAEHAASLVKIDYVQEKPMVYLEEMMSGRFTPKVIPVIDTPPVDSSRGNVASALAAAKVKLELTYTTPTENQNPMELSATTAAWEGDRLTVWDSTQWVMGVRAVLSTQLGIPLENIRVISHFVGGAFGAKTATWPHTTLAAVAARQVGRPVKLVVTRHQMFSSTGHRPQTIQRLSLGASSDGKLTALIHDSTSHTSPFDEYVEATAVVTRMLYACPNLKTMHRIARLNVNTPSVMRGPGEASGTFALESAMDELAYAVKIDPLELRLRNYAETDLHSRLPFSSKALRECYRQGADRFGWSRRKEQPGSMRDADGKLIGLGMATAVYPTKRSPSEARVRLYPDGTAIAASATHELGTGAYTAMAQVAADALGMSLDNVRFELGDSTLPNGPLAGGSQSAASVGSAVQAAALDVRRKIIALAVADSSSPLYRQKVEAITTQAGRMFVQNESNKGETYAEVLQRNGYTSLKPLESQVDSAPGEEKKKFSSWAFGAQFCEVQIDPDLGEIRIARWVGAFCAGKILNTKTARSQVLGSIVWGIGMALQEHTVRDFRWGKIVNDDMAEYHVPVNADIPAIDAFFVEENDPHVNPLGAKGVGELGITGTAAAIANAVYHATGKRIRDLPITLDKLL